MIFPVFLFVRAGELMLFDYVVQVIVNRSTSYYAILFSAIHGLGIDIKAVLLILEKDSFTEHALKILFSFLIYLRRVMIEIIRKVNLRLDDMIKRIRIAFGFGSCLFLIQHIVRTARYALH